MYGIMNEHQVAIGESTCAAKLYAAPIGFGGKALLEVRICDCYGISGELFCRSVNCHKLHWKEPKQLVRPF